jgi:hypothetical protein
VGLVSYAIGWGPLHDKHEVVEAFGVWVTTPMMVLVLSAAEPPRRQGLGSCINGAKTHTHLNCQTRQEKLGGTHAAGGRMSWHTWCKLVDVCERGFSGLSWI